MLFPEATLKLRRIKVCFHKWKHTFTHLRHMKHEKKKIATDSASGKTRFFAFCSKSLVVTTKKNEKKHEFLGPISGPKLVRTGCNYSSLIKGWLKPPPPLFVKLRSASSTKKGGFPKFCIFVARALFFMPLGNPKKNAFFLVHFVFFFLCFRHKKKFRVFFVMHKKKWRRKKKSCVFFHACSKKIMHKKKLHFFLKISCEFLKTFRFFYFFLEKKNKK